MYARRLFCVSALENKKSCRNERKAEFVRHICNAVTILFIIFIL